MGGQQNHSSYREKVRTELNRDSHHNAWPFRKTTMLRLNKCDHNRPLFLLAGGGDIKMGCTAQHCTELDVLGLAKHVHQCPSFRGERGAREGG